MLAPYKELEFKYEGKSYFPMSTDVYEVDDGIHRNFVVDSSGSYYHAFYTEEDATADYWDSPFKIEPII